MIEQRLAALFREFADEIRYHRVALADRVPKAETLCGGIDELTSFLERQSRTLLSEAERYTVPCIDTGPKKDSSQSAREERIMDTPEREARWIRCPSCNG